MRIKYFADTDTALFEFSGNPIEETKAIDENIYMDFDRAGHLVGMTIEHAKLAANMSELVYQQMEAG
ncbi:MAG TPA: DUF2283 domain-containing protein, partial [Methylococcales bacterium]